MRFFGVENESENENNTLINETVVDDASGSTEALEEVNDIEGEDNIPESSMKYLRLMLKLMLLIVSMI